MTVNYTTNLALGQPVTGTESGTWGDDVNNSVTSYLDIAIAGGLAVTITTTDVTLTLTQGTSSATNIGSTTAQYAILNVSGAMTAARNLILPSSSRQYVINNACTGGFLLTVKGSATSGVTMVNGEKAHVFWNGSDYAKLSNTPGGAGTFSSITNTGLTSGRVVYSTTGGLETDSANLTFDGTNLTLAGGTANGVAYLNGSKVLTTGSALSFSGSTLALQTAAGTSAVMNLTSGSNATQTKFNIGQAGSIDWDVGISVTTGNFYIGGLGGTVAEAYRITRTGTAVDYQTWNTGGSERMRIDASGNVVIGQTTATNKFNVVSSDSTSAVGSSTASICITNTYTGAYGYSSDLIYRLGGGAGTKLAGISGIYTAGGGELALYTYNGTTFAEKMRIDSSGNVGIGVSGPGAKLDVSGAIRSTGTSAILAFSKRSTGIGDAWGMYSQSGEYNIYDYTAGVSRLVIDTSGNLLVGITSATAGSILQLSNAISGTAGASNKISLYYASAASAFGFGVASAQLTYNSGDGAHVFYNGGNTSPVERARIDASGNVLVTSAAGLGYGTGSGGTVTQATSKSTAVTLNKPTGRITMNNAALLPSTSVNFSLNNSVFGDADVCIVNPLSSDNYTVTVYQSYSGVINMRVTNYSASTLSDALQIKFAIIKGSIT
jgi:hypothetical protein